MFRLNYLKSITVFTALFFPVFVKSHPAGLHPGSSLCPETGATTSLPTDTAPAIFSKNSVGPEPQADSIPTGKA